MKVSRLLEILNGLSNDPQVRVEVSPNKFVTVTGVVWRDKDVVLRLHQKPVKK